MISTLIKVLLSVHMHCQNDAKQLEAKTDKVLSTHNQNNNHMHTIVQQGMYFQKIFSSKI